jgi:hypothetical protein
VAESLERLVELYRLMAKTNQAVEAKSYLRVELVQPTERMKERYARDRLKERMLFARADLSRMLGDYEKRHEQVPPGAERCAGFVPRYPEDFEQQDEDSQEYDRKRHSNCARPGCDEGWNLLRHRKAVRAIAEAERVRRQEVYQAKGYGLPEGDTARPGEELLAAWVRSRGIELEVVKPNDWLQDPPHFVARRLQQGAPPEEFLAIDRALAESWESEKAARMLKEDLKEADYYREKDAELERFLALDK